MLWVNIAKVPTELALASDENGNLSIILVATEGARTPPAVYPETVELEDGGPAYLPAVSCPIDVALVSVANGHF